MKRKLKAAKDDLPQPWDDPAEPISIERWRRHRSTMMAWCAPGKRPLEWWTYEKDIEQPAQEAAVLFEMGELGAAELAQLTADWRAQYERGQAPEFSYCTGQESKPGGGTSATWISGAAARGALYDWAGIPPALIKQWNAERRRRAKTIPTLAKGEVG